MARTYRVISGDSHLEISPERWRGHVDPKYRDRAPRLVKLATGGDATLVEGRGLSVLGLAVTGIPYDQYKPTGVTYEGGHGTGSPQQRIAEQDQDGIDAEVIFTGPGNIGVWRGIRDDVTFAAVVHGYNRFLAEEYCAAAPDRLLAMAVLPASGVDDAIREMEYCKRAGLKGVMLGSFPSGRGVPTPDDDRFWAAAIDLDMPLTVHVRFIGDERPVFAYPRRPAEVESFGVDPVFNLVRFAGEQCLNAMQMVMAGVFDRYPRLRIYWAETMIGWIPYFLTQLGDNWARTRHWAERFYGLEAPRRDPGEYLLENCWWGFLRDPFGVEMRHRLGIEHLMWGNDFPHSAGDWPHSQKVVDDMFAGVPDAERQKMVARNAVEYFKLESAVEQAAPGAIRTA